MNNEPTICNECRKTMHDGICPHCASVNHELTPNHAIEDTIQIGQVRSTGKSFDNLKYIVVNAKQKNADFWECKTSEHIALNVLSTNRILELPLMARPATAADSIMPGQLRYAINWTSSGYHAWFVVLCKSIASPGYTGKWVVQTPHHGHLWVMDCDLINKCPIAVPQALPAFGL